MPMKLKDYLKQRKTAVAKLTAQYRKHPSPLLFTAIALNPQKGTYWTTEHYGKGLHLPCPFDGYTFYGDFVIQDTESVLEQLQEAGYKLGDESIWTYFKR